MSLEIGTRVELLPDRDQVYKKAVAGTQGTITDCKLDEGFEMVFVEWDRDHWRYAGEPDCWTFESHFKSIDDGLFNALESRDEFVRGIIEKAEERDDIDDAKIERFIDRLNEAVNLLSESDGFLLISAKKEIDPERPNEVLLTPYVFSGYLDQGAMILLEAQIVQLAAISHQENAFHLLSRLAQEEREEEEEE